MTCRRTRRSTTPSSYLTSVGAFLEASAPVVVITGEGLNAEAGMPTVAGLSRPQLRADPAAGWAGLGAKLQAYGRATPSPAHRAIARLERAGLVAGVLTENVDLMHVDAGAGRVVPLYGSVGQTACPACGYAEPFGCLLDMRPELIPPRCAACGELLEPEFQMADEVPRAHAIERAEDLLRAANGVLILGQIRRAEVITRLIAEALPSQARLAVAVDGPSPFDDLADLRVEATADAVLASAVAALDAS